LLMLALLATASINSPLVIRFHLPPHSVGIRLRLAWSGAPGAKAKSDHFQFA
jgi:hypothetical protein